MVASTATNLLSLLLLATSVQLRMKLPLLRVLSKTDLARNPKEIVKWGREAAAFEQALADDKAGGDSYTFYTQLFRALRHASITPDLYPVSGYTRDGFIALVGELSRISSGGEELEES